jgi:hypothetical protein
MGAISIVMGLILTFYGSKFILILFGLLCFLITQILIFAILYNTHMFKPEHIESKKGQILGIGAVVVAIGGVASYYMAKFADKFAIPLISAWCGGIATFMIIGATKMPGGVKLVVIVAVAGAAAYYTKKIQRYVKSVGTALIGSFILFNGIGKYVGGYPQIISTQSESDAGNAAIEEANKEMGAMALFYLGGTVAFTVLGTWVQLTYVIKKEEEQEEDDFTNAKYA